MKSYGVVLAFFGIFALLCCSVHAEVVPLRACAGNDGNAASHCTIHEVRISPCKEAAEGKPCRLKRGKSASIEFDFTPDFAAANLTAEAFWVNSIFELPFDGLQKNACLATTCPTTPGQRQTYQLNLPISKSYPSSTYDVKWKVWTGEGEAQSACCFMFLIKIHK